MKRKRDPILWPDGARIAITPCVAFEHEAGAALASPGEAHLVVRPVLARRILLATADLLPADVVLLGQATGADLVQCGDLLLEATDPRLDLTMCPAHVCTGS